MNTKSLTREQFIKRAENSLSFYEALPSDHITITNDTTLTQAQFDEHIARFVHMDMTTTDPSVIDEIILYLLAHPNVKAHTLLQACARSAITAFAMLLKGNKSNRTLRMRLAHLSYCIQDILDKDIVIIGAQHTPLPYIGPWDFLQGKMWVVSEEKNIIAGDKAYRLGMPSQIDELGDGRISIGSIFTNGAFLWQDGNAIEVPHDKPIVLLWLQSDRLWALDYRGTFFEVNKREETAVTIDLDQISKCRRIDNALYIFDWTRLGEITVVDLHDCSIRQIRLPEIFLGDDIIRVGDYFYVIDKFQGSIFKYDRKFIFKDKHLAFGKGQGRIIDPISIRNYDEKLMVINWLIPALVTCDLF